MKNIMIDLETMGNNSFAPIISIGAVYFDKTGIGNTFYKRASLDSCLKAGMKPDASTILWWLKQSDEARKEFENNENEHDLISLLAAFNIFYTEGSLVWGNGANFDIVILENAYKCLNYDVPWKYNEVRCFRTLKSFFPDIKINNTDLIRHNALCDAVWQANYAVEILKRLEKENV